VAPNKYVNRAVSLLYSIECADEATNDTDLVNMWRNQIPDIKLTSSNETDDDMNLCDEESGNAPDLCVSRSSQPTRSAAIAARSKLKLWLNPDDDAVLLGSVADHARN